MTRHHTKTPESYNEYDDRNYIAEYAQQRGFNFKPEADRRRELAELDDSLHAAAFPRHAAVIREARAKADKPRTSIGTRVKVLTALTLATVAGAEAREYAAHANKVRTEMAELTSPKAYNDFMQGKLDHEKYKLVFAPKSENVAEFVNELGATGDQRDVEDMFSGQLGRATVNAGEPLVIPVDRLPMPEDQNK